MISFRYHIASLVAVLLALAAGVALGAGPLEDDVEGAQTPTASGTDVETLVEDSSFDDAFVGSYQSTLVADRLKGYAVTLMVLPGAAPEHVTSLTTGIAQAGGSVAATVRVSPELVDASRRQLVDELGGQLEAGATKLVVSADAGTYDRLGALLGYAVTTVTAAGDAIDRQGKGILAGLSTAGLVSTDADLQRRGSLVLVVGGPPEEDEEAAEGAAGIVLSLVKALDASSSGVVVAGPASAAGPTGVLTGVRNDPAAAGAVSTVDHADKPAGVVATMQAMQEQISKKAGQYGAGAGATGPRPGVVAPG